MKHTELLTVSLNPQHTIFQLFWGFVFLVMFCLGEILAIKLTWPQQSGLTLKVLLGYELALYNLLAGETLARQTVTGLYTHVWCVCISAWFSIGYTSLHFEFSQNPNITHVVSNHTQSVDLWGFNTVSAWSRHDESISMVWRLYTSKSFSMYRAQQQGEVRWHRISWNHTAYPSITVMSPTQRITTFIEKNGY